MPNIDGDREVLNLIWTRGIPRDIMKRAINNSLDFYGATPEDLPMLFSKLKPAISSSQRNKQNERRRRAKAN